MSYTRIFDDLPEAREARPSVRAADGISLALGSAVFVASHRFAGLHVVWPVGRSPALPVSRVYWKTIPSSFP